MLQNCFSVNMLWCLHHLEMHWTSWSTFRYKHKQSSCIFVCWKKKKKGDKFFTNKFEKLINQLLRVVSIWLYSWFVILYFFIFFFVSGASWYCSWVSHCWSSSAKNILKFVFPAYSIFFLWILTYIFIANSNNIGKIICEILESYC